MGKLVWLVLPALAGCGALPQVAGQGTGAHPGGNASYERPPILVPRPI